MIVGRTLLFLIFAVLAASGCRGVGDGPSLKDVSKGLLEATPSGERVALSADLDALTALSNKKKLGNAERQALIDLYRSARRDGSLDEDERVLLTRLTRDVVAGGGSYNRLLREEGSR